MCLDKGALYVFTMLLQQLQRDVARRNRRARHSMVDDELRPTY